MGPVDDTAVKAPSAGGWKSWSTKKKLLVLGSILLLIIALAVGLGVGLGVGLNNGGGDEEGGEEGETPPTTGNNNTSVKWQPAVGTSWQIQLLYPINDTSLDVDVYDIDLFDNSKAIIDELHDLGRKVICYFSAGTYEDWRPDESKFRKSDLGSPMEDWEGETWLDLSSTNVRDIMTTRLDLAHSKGCDGVDPDNVDGYDNENGLDLTPQDSIDYMNWMAGEARARNLSIGLKNAGHIIPSVIGNMQWSVNEQCAQYNECDTYAAFIRKGKPVFHLEYPKGDDTNNNIMVTGTKKKDACNFTDSGNFSTLIKNMNLNEWYETC